VTAAEELLALYRELDAELVPLQSSCRACGRCCDFSTHGHVLYATLLERQVLAAAGPGESAERGLICQYLEGRECTARENRPLGCRTHYCQAEAGERGRELYEKYRKRLAEISRRHELAWDYRPVLECLLEERQGDEEARP
jgi:Fe-S-cluster containining protein